MPQWQITLHFYIWDRTKIVIVELVPVDALHLNHVTCVTLFIFSAFP